MSAIDFILPSEPEIALAGRTGRALAASYHNEPTFTVQLPDRQETIELPAAAVRLLIDVLNQMAQGNAVTLMPIHAELTTQQAADLLHVSRPYLVGLLDKGEIPCRKVGTHRRVLAQDLLAYRNDTRRKRGETLDELAAFHQEIGLE